LEIFLSSGLTRASVADRWYLRCTHDGFAYGGLLRAANLSMMAHGYFTRRDDGCYILVAGLVKGVIGMGLPSIAIALLALAMPPA
jgi:hypothetical protein